MYKKGDIVIMMDLPDTRKNTNYARFIGNTGRIIKQYERRGDTFVQVVFDGKPWPVSVFAWRVKALPTEPDWRV